MSSQIGNTLAKRKMQKLENLQYYVLSTLFPLPVHLDDQCGEFLESWMAYQEFNKFPDLFKYYTTIGNRTILKEEYTTIKEHALLKDIKHFFTLPNHISWMAHPTKSYTHYYWSISYPIRLLGHYARRPNSLGVSSR